MQFNAYASFLAFFGLSKLPLLSDNFTGIVDYASSMAFELVTTAPVTSTSYPTPEQISVRFLFSNGSAAYNGLTAYPLFGQSKTTLPWNTFTAEMAKIAIGDQASWCKACGNTTGVCASTTSTTTSTGGEAPATVSGASSSSSDFQGSGISTVVAGVIGAVVTLAVILGIEVIVMLLGGLRLVRKKAFAAPPVHSENMDAGKA